MELLTKEMLEEPPDGSTQHGEEVVSGEGVTTQPPETVTVGPKPYTDAEVEAILEADGKLDSTRLTPSQKLIQKSFERHYQRRYQDLATKKREVERPPARTVYEQFDQDPSGVMKDLRVAIAQKKKEDPFSDEVIRLETLRDELLERGMTRGREESRVSRAASEAEGQIRKAIPDFEVKAPKLTEFAVNELGFSMEEIDVLSDPAKVGPLAVKVTKAINVIYDRFNAGTAAGKKEVKKVGPLARPGGGGAPTVDEDKMSADEWIAKRNKQVHGS